MPLIRRIAAILFFLLLTVVAAAAGNLWNIGAFSFSDELGGFRIVGVSGAGTRDDPIMVKQELYSASEMVLTIRVSAPGGPKAQSWVCRSCAISRLDKHERQ